MKRSKRIVGALIPFLLAVAAGITAAADWPQAQKDPGRGGFTSDRVDAPFRPRWIWMGPGNTLRNRLSKPDDPGWRDDLSTGPGKNYPMPKSLPFSFAAAMQPILADGKVFAADLQGGVYAIAADSGASVWTARQTAGSLGAGAAIDGKVVFASADGIVSAFDAKDGTPAWRFDSGRAITMPILAADGRIFVGNHGGWLFCLDARDGSVVWKTRRGAPIQGGLCLAGGDVYGCDEAMAAFCVDAGNGALKAERRIGGQSFRFEWPVAVGGRVVFMTVPAVCPGAEYVNDPILAGKPDSKIGYKPDLKPGYPDPVAEEDAVRGWLASDSGRLWESVFSLKQGSLEKDYIVAAGATEGCGTPPNPPALNSKGMPILWWASAYGSLLGKCGFGFNYTMDICSFNPQTGRRVILNSKRADGQTTEADNLYAFSVGGDILFLRQNFRGTTAIDLANAKFHPISSEYGARDGGERRRPLNYAAGLVEGHPSDWPENIAKTPKTPAVTSNGRSAPAISDGKLVFSESFAISCVEHDDGSKSPPAAANPAQPTPAAAANTAPPTPQTAPPEQAPANPSDQALLKYIWENPSTPVPPDNVPKWAAAILDEEVKAVIEKGPLAPLRLSYGDAPEEEPYWIYTENGRIITTLAAAYPYLQADRQRQVRGYVDTLLAKGKDLPWKPGIKASDDGATPERQSTVCRSGIYPNPGKVPTLHTLYGFWLYIDRTGDPAPLQNNWTAIRKYYADNCGPSKILYGQMGAHIAMARMARLMNDPATEQLATNAFLRDARAGLNPRNIENRIPNTCFTRYSEPRYNNFFPGNPWIFINAPPEIWRYLSDNLHHDTQKRLGAFEDAYPLWWLNPAPYFTRWTGDESIGTTPETFSILLPYHRYVLKDDPDKLLAYMRSAPVSVGDSHWLEALVTAIEAP